MHGFAHSKAGGLCAVEIVQEGGGALRVGFGKRERAGITCRRASSCAILLVRRALLSLEIGEGLG